MSEWREIYTLLSTAAQQRLWLLLVLMLLGAFAEMASLGAVVPFLTLLVSPELASRIPFMGTSLVNQPAQKVIWVVGGLFLTGLLVATLMRVWLLHATNQFAHQTGYELTTRTFRTILAQPYLWHVQNNSVDHLTQLSRVNQFISQSVQPILIMLTSIVLGFGILVILFATEPIIMGLMTLFVTLFYLLTVFTVRNQLAHNGVLINEAAVIKTRLLQESLGGIRDVILDHSQIVQTNSFSKVEKIVRKAMVANEWISQLPRYLVEFFGIVTIVVLALVFSKSGNTPVATLGLLALGSQRLLPLAQKIYESFNTLRVATAARKDILHLMSLSDDIAPSPEQSLPFERVVSFEQVSFRYPTTKGWVLKDINITLSKGERIGIIGSSGGGKSTLMDLFLGLLEPTFGDILIDGVLLTPQNLPAWRKRIAHVPQNIFLLDATLRENIALGIPEESIDEFRLKACIAQAQLSEVVEKLPQAEHTVIGERGVLLSGGQRQRIGIARALYRQADVLVMDEATSALDNQTEAEVISAIANLGENITILMIAHRLTTLSFCDRILNIEIGKLKL